jgi:hypothetical protein
VEVKPAPPKASLCGARIRTKTIANQGRECGGRSTGGHVREEFAAGEGERFKFHRVVPLIHFSVCARASFSTAKSLLLGIPFRSPRAAPTQDAHRSRRVRGVCSFATKNVFRFTSFPDQRSSPTGETYKFSISFFIFGSFFTAADHLLDGLSICVSSR